jgi:cysteine synthase
MIRAAEAAGALKPGGALVEPTSGNTGIGLAWICAQLGFIPAVLECKLLDKVVRITDAEAISTCIKLNRHGISAGISSGANIAAAQQVAAGFDAGCNVVTIICDGVERYLSANLFV